jgi:hypothetical protein
MEARTRRDRREERWRARAERARDAFGLVLVLVVLTYVLASVFDNEDWSGVLLTVFVSATAVVAFVSSHAPPTLVRRSIAIAAVATLLAVVSAISGGRLGLNIASFIVIGMLAGAMAAVLGRVVTSDTVTSRTILGAVSIYTTMGLLFTWAYSVIDRIEGGDFFGEGVSAGGGDFIFFSYTTLTTTGYGDLVPVSQVGRMISGLEMMIGQVFLVTLVAGLVSLWQPGRGLLRRRERRDGPEGGDAVRPAGPGPRGA